MHHILVYIFFFFNDTATTEIYTLSLHDALPICPGFPINTFPDKQEYDFELIALHEMGHALGLGQDRKSTRLNSSHLVISYAVFCLKKKKKNKYQLVVYETLSLLSAYISGCTVYV